LTEPLIDLIEALIDPGELALQEFD
jgi:hypothetical protein